MAIIQDLIALARQNLLDLSNRNRLLNCRLDSDRVLRVFADLPDQVYQMLVIEKKSMRFLPIPEPVQGTDLLNADKSSEELEQPEGDGNDIPKTERQNDSCLQTKLTSTKLQTRLLRIYYDAQTAIEEQGINILYLALGFLKWYESNDSDAPKYAPLILVPVKLERRSATSRFHLSWSEEDIETNESLVVKLQKEFGVELPRLPEEVEALMPSKYFEKVKRTINKPKWEVVDEIAIGFFAFGKLRLWKDLDPTVWAVGTGPEKNDIVNAILLAQQMQTPSPYSDEEFVDNCTDNGNLLLVKDADSSQVLTILEVLSGRSVVVQGPPGTGKSQTITNIIANNLAMGKTVLFVSEKMAALEVVKRWLDQVGLGDFCLELHSFKARKTQVIGSIRQTIESQRPVTPDLKTESGRLDEKRNRLNEFAFAMNTPLVDGGITPHKAIGIIENCCRNIPHLKHIPLPAAASWTNNQLRQNRDNIALVARHLAVVGDPRQHPWRGVMASALLHSDRPKLNELLISMLVNLKRLLAFSQSIGNPLGLNIKYTLKNCTLMFALCDLFVERPNSDPKAISDSAWLTKQTEIETLLKNGSQYVTLHTSLLDEVTENVLGHDYEQTRSIFKEKGHAVTRFLSGDYWRARKHIVQSCKKNKRPKNYKDTIRLLDSLCEYRELRTYLTSNNSLGAMAFGEQWEGLQSDWILLRTVAEWVLKVIALLENNTILVNCNGINSTDLTRDKNEAANLRHRLDRDLVEWEELLKYNYSEAFGETCSETVPLDTWILKLEAAQNRIEAIFEWIEYCKNRDTCRQLEMLSLIDLVDKGEIAPEQLIPQYDYSSASEILRQALVSRSILGQFNGATHSHIVEQYRSLDKKLVETTRQYLAAKLWDRLPQPTLGDPSTSPMNYIVNMFRKRRGIPPIRQFMERAGSIIKQIKPCFMMSPMSIAQFLPPNMVEFDVLVIDEASQMKPEDALGALARCKQCVIVGDSKQLPPTRFFDRLGESNGEEDDISDVESILEAATHPIGGIRGGRMLRWHYRSRHESLIAFSNKEFYESKLHVFPSPIHTCGELGLVGHYIEKGVYERSGSRKNLIEAEAVARAVMNHARNCGEQSLGVVALSKQQQEAVMDKLEELRRENTEAESFFDTGRLEPFFVKNLENVQGDERDVIFISIGYGKDLQGYFHMNFGPLNREGGWRRLNVLITRARLRCELFHSIRADEIRIADLSDAEQYSLRGRVALRNYLEYARTGQLEQPGIPGEDVESPFEESVAEALRQHGVDVVPQVGVAGFRIDLGIIDPNNRGKYILGIECDGATYHSARSARDRDRLRQEVLEKLGWKIHRIWSLDWLKDREKEMRRLLLAIEEAQSVSTPDNTSSGERPKATIIERTDLQKEAKFPYELISKPYVKYTKVRPMSGHPSDINSDRMVDLITKIVEVESPIHIDELNRRVAEMFGLQRTGNRIQTTTLKARRGAEYLKKVKCIGKFVWDSKMKQPTVRNRRDMNMDIERIAPEEICSAAEKINKLTFGLAEDALVTEVSKSLGYHRVTANIDKYIRSALSKAKII